MIIAGSHDTRHKRLIHKSQPFFYILAINKWNFKLRTQCHLHLHSNIKYLCINLTNMLKIFMRETYKILMSEIKELIILRDMPCHKQESSILSIGQLFPIWPINSTQPQSKSQQVVNIGKLILKYIWRDQTTRITTSVLKKNKVRGLTLPNSRLTLKLW